MGAQDKKGGQRKQGGSTKKKGVDALKEHWTVNEKNTSAPRVISQGGEQHSRSQKRDGPQELKSKKEKTRKRKGEALKKQRRGSTKGADREKDLRGFS